MLRGLISQKPPENLIEYIVRKAETGMEKVAAKKKMNPSTRKLKYYTHLREVIKQKRALANRPAKVEITNMKMPVVGETLQSNLPPPLVQGLPGVGVHPDRRLTRGLPRKKRAKKRPSSIGTDDDEEPDAFNVTLEAAQRTPPNQRSPPGQQPRTGTPARRSPNQQRTPPGQGTPNQRSPKFVLPGRPPVAGDGSPRTRRMKRDLRPQNIEASDMLFQHIIRNRQKI